jgi:hypothetical protein
VRSRYARPAAWLAADEQDDLPVGGQGVGDGRVEGVEVAAEVVEEHQRRATGPGRAEPAVGEADVAGGHDLSRRDVVAVGHGVLSGRRRSDGGGQMAVRPPSAANTAPVM